MGKNINILIVNTFGIGDVLFSTPLIKALKKAFPLSAINYVCNERTYHVLKNNPNLNNIIHFEKDYFRHLFKKSKIVFLKEFIKFCVRIKLLKTDLMIDLTLNYQASIPAILGGIKKRIGFNYRNRGKFLTGKLELDGFDEKHVALYYLDLLKIINAYPENNVYTEAYTSKESDEWVDAFIKENRIENKKIVVLMPGGGRSWGEEAKYRRWPTSNFAHVADKLIRDLGVFFILLGDKDEKPLCDNTKSFMHEKDVINLGGQTTVSELMSFIKRSSMVLCNEGGPLHIAVALDTPTVSIFGPVDEKIYGPFCRDKSRHMIVSNRSKCLPCYAKFKHNRECKNLTCLNSISEEQVYSAVEMLVRKIIKQD